MLHGEPGLLALTGHALDVVGFWLGHVLDRAREGSPDQAAVDALQRRILAGLEVLRTLDGPARDAAEDAVVAALGLGFHHAGGPETVDRIEAELEAKQGAKRVVLMNKGRRRPDDVVNVVLRYRDTYISNHPGEAGTSTACAKYIVKNLRKDIESSHELPETVKLLFKPSEGANLTANELRLLEDRVRKLLRDEAQADEQ